VKTIVAELAAVLGVETKRVAWALRVSIAGGETWRYTDWDQPVEINGEDYCSWPLTVRSISNTDDPAQTSAVVRLVAAPSLSDAVDDLSLRGAEAALFGLYGVAPDPGHVGVLWPLQTFAGVVEVPSVHGGSAELRLGAGGSWTTEAPDLYLPTCRYHLESQCDQVQGCPRTWAACTTRGRRAIFGGYRYLPPDWLVIQYRDGSGVAGR